MTARTALAKILGGARNLTTIAVGVLLVGFVAFLLVSNYVSQMDLRRDALVKLKHETEKRASAVSYFFAERKNDLENLANSRVISVFFENKALGMSLEYGLRASLYAISERFAHIVDSKRIGGYRIYTNLLFIDSDGRKLVSSRSPDAKEVSAQDWRSLLRPEGSEAVIIARGDQMAISVPYRFKNRYSGQIIAWIAPRSVHEQLVKGRQAKSQFIAIFAGEDNFYAAQESSRRIFSAALPHFRSLKVGKARRFHLREEEGRLRDVIAVRVPVPGTPFSLINVLPASEVFGRTAPWQLLLALAVLSILILGGVAVVWRVNAQKMVLRARLEEASRREQEVEEKNRELEREIAERRRVEEALTKSEQRYRVVVEDMPEMICRFLPDGTLTFVNSAYCSYFNRQREDLVGQNFFQFIPEEDQDKVRHHFLSLTRDHPIITYEHQAIAPDGSIRWQQWTDRAIFDEEDRLLEYQSLGNDITEKIIAREERARLEKQLQHAQKMEAIGTLAGGIAHDFNNLLQAVQGYAQLLLFKKKLKEQDQRELQEIVHAARRGGELTQKLLTFSRKVESKRKPLDINHEVREVQRLLERTIPRMIEIELHLAEELTVVDADPMQVEQVIMNLALNAKDAMPEGGKIFIETENVTIHEEYPKAHVGARPGDYVLLSISDTGHGMGRETLEHIFEPFFTTKEPGKGTGLGLAMVYGIVKSHDGFILCYSEPGEGTTFRIYLPVARHRTEKAVATQAEGQIPGGDETILLVEDDQCVLDVAENFLKSFGYQVLTANDGESALEYYRREQGQIDLVILDLIMPGMGGKKCLEELLEIDPDVKVIIASGYPPNGRKEEIIAAGARAFVRKPFEPRELLELVREILDGNEHQPQGPAIKNPS